MVRRTDDGGARCFHGDERGPQVIVGLTHVEAEVVQADTAALGDRRRVRPDLDEQQLMVRAARGEGGHPNRSLSRLGDDLGPSEHVPVEGGGPLDVAHVEHQVAELAHRHAVAVSVTGAAATCAACPSR